MCGGGFNNAVIDLDKEHVDQMDIIQMVVRETIKKGLKLKVERETDVDAQSFSVHLELNGEVIPDSYVVLSLDFGHHDDDMAFEIV